MNLLVCRVRPYLSAEWSAEHNSTGLQSTTLLVCRARPCWSAVHDLIGLQSTTLLVCRAGPYWSVEGNPWSAEYDPIDQSTTLLLLWRLLPCWSAEWSAENNPINLQIMTLY